MAYQYSLLDDDDELGSLLEPNTLQSVAPTAQEMAPSPQQQRAPMLQAPARDPELDNAYRGLELQKIHEAQKPSYGFGEAARDIIPTGLALALDAALNRGRGALGILQGGMNEVGAQQAARDKARQDAGEMAVKLHGRDKTDPLAYLRAQTAQQNAGTAAARVAGTADRFAAQGNPESDYSKGRVTQQERMTGAGARGRINTEAELADVSAETKAKASEATTNATTDALRENPRDLTADQVADNARADAQLQAQLEANALTRETSARNKKADQSSKYNADLGDAMTVLEKARQLQDIFKQHPDDLPGVGAIDASRFLPDYFRSPDDIRVGQLFAEFSNPQFRDIAGRAVTGPEAARVQAQVGNLGSSNEDVVRNAVNEIANTMSGRIRSGSVGREDLAREILATRGMGDLLPAPTSGGSPRAAPEVPTVVPGGVEPGVEDVPGDLGVTGGHRLRDVPPQGNLASPAQVQAVQQSGGLVTVRLNGKTAQVPRAQAEAMKRINPGLEVF